MSLKTVAVSIYHKQPSEIRLKSYIKKEANRPIHSINTLHTQTSTHTAHAQSTDNRSTYKQPINSQTTKVRGAQYSRQVGPP